MEMSGLREKEPLLHSDSERNQLKGNKEAENSPSQKQKEEDDFFQRKLEEYTQSFSIIGFSRVFHGHTYEKVFWFLNILLAVGISVFLIRDQIGNFIKRDTYFDKNSVVTIKNSLPTITLCTADMSTEHFCGKDVLKFYKITSESDKPCNYSRLDHRVNNHDMAIDTKRGLAYGSIPIRVNCRDHTCTPEDLDVLMESWKPIEKSSKCIQWNVNSSISFPRSKYEFKIISKEKYLQMFIHHGGESAYLFDKYLELHLTQNTRVRTSKVFTKYLPSPYQSNCVAKEDETKFTIFPGRYTVEACLNTLKCKEAIKKCGATFDFCRPYMPREMTMKYQKVNQTLLDILQSKCLRSFEYSEDSLNCPVPCEQYTYKVDLMSSSPLSQTWFPSIVSVELDDPHGYLVREEKPLVTMTDLLGIIGGTIGLFCGFSILSLLELLCFAVIKLVILRAKGSLGKKSSKDERV